MSQVILSERARQDISRLYFFLAEKDEAAALRAVETIEAAFSSLRAFPQMCECLEEDASLRELVIEFGNSGYLALYHFDEMRDTVIVLAIKHQLEDDYGLLKITQKK